MNKTQERPVNERLVGSIIFDVAMLGSFEQAVERFQKSGDTEEEKEAIKEFFYVRRPYIELAASQTKEFVRDCAQIIENAAPKLIEQALRKR